LSTSGLSVLVQGQVAGAATPRELIQSIHDANPIRSKRNVIIKDGGLAQDHFLDEVCAFTRSVKIAALPVAAVALE
jgi:hypothetical protein